MDSKSDHLEELKDRFNINLTRTKLLRLFKYLKAIEMCGLTGTLINNRNVTKEYIMKNENVSSEIQFDTEIIKKAPRTSNAFNQLAQLGLIEKDRNIDTEDDRNRGYQLTILGEYALSIDDPTILLTKQPVKQIQSKENTIQLIHNKQLKDMLNSMYNEVSQKRIHIRLSSVDSGLDEISPFLPFFFENDPIYLDLKNHSALGINLEQIEIDVQEIKEFNNNVITSKNNLIEIMINQLKNELNLDYNEMSGYPNSFNKNMIDFLIIKLIKSTNTNLDPIFMIPLNEIKVTSIQTEHMIDIKIKGETTVCSIEKDPKVMKKYNVLEKIMRLEYSIYSGELIGVFDHYTSSMKQLKNKWESLTEILKRLKDTVTFKGSCIYLE